METYADIYARGTYKSEEILRKCFAKITAEAARNVDWNPTKRAAMLSIAEIRALCDLIEARAE